jgi:hypothetical protein
MTTTTTTKPRSTRTAKAKAEPVLSEAELAALATAKAEAERTERVALLKAAWSASATKQDAAESIFKTARQAINVAKVYKARVAIRLGMELANEASAFGPNFSATHKELDVAEATLRPYWNAGKALAAAGLENNTGEPTPDEIKIVQEATRKAPKAKAPATGTEGTEGTEGTAKAPEPKQDPITQDSVIAAVEALQDAVTRFTREHGFSATVADNLTATLAEIGATIETFKVDGGK